MDDYIERDNEYVQSYYDDLNPRFLELHQRYSSPDDKTYYLPGEFNTMCIWYSKEIFQQAGVDEPTSDWSWDDFLETAEALTDPGNVFGMYLEPNYFAGIMPWLLTNGTSTLNEDWTESTVSSPQAIEAMEFTRSMVADGISPQAGGRVRPVHPDVPGQAGDAWWREVAVA